MNRHKGGPPGARAIIAGEPFTGDVVMCMFGPGSHGVNCHAVKDFDSDTDLGVYFFVDFDGRGGVLTQATLDGKPLTDLPEFLAHAAKHTMKVTAEKSDSDPDGDCSASRADFVTTG